MLSLRGDPSAGETFFTRNPAVKCWKCHFHILLHPSSETEKQTPDKNSSFTILGLTASHLYLQTSLIEHSHTIILAVRGILVSKMCREAWVLHKSKSAPRSGPIRSALVETRPSHKHGNKKIFHWEQFVFQRVEHKVKAPYKVSTVKMYEKKMAALQNTNRSQICSGTYNGHMMVMVMALLLSLILCLNFTQFVF